MQKMHVAWSGQAPPVCGGLCAFRVFGRRFRGLVSAPLSMWYFTGNRFFSGVWHRLGGPNHRPKRLDLLGKVKLCGYFYFMRGCIFAFLR
jgi:hypothetical protein